MSISAKIFSNRASGRASLDSDNMKAVRGGASAMEQASGVRSLQSTIDQKNQKGVGRGPEEKS